MIPFTGKITPAIHKTPFEVLGRMVKPKFDMLPCDVNLDNRKGARVSENGRIRITCYGRINHGLTSVEQLNFSGGGKNKVKRRGSEGASLF